MRGRREGAEVKINIEKGIPLPPQHTTLGMRIFEMEVGDSFALVNPSLNIKQRIRQAFKAAGYSYEARYGFGGEVRFWRTK